MYPSRAYSGVNSFYIAVKLQQISDNHQQLLSQSEQKACADWVVEYFPKIEKGAQ